MNTRSPANADSLRREVYYLADALLSNVISEEEAERLQTIISEDAEARRHYIRFMHDSSTLCQWGQDSADADKNPPLTIPTLSTTHYPLPTTFVGGPVFSYMVATVVLCLMLLGAWAYKINHDSKIALDNSRRSMPSGLGDQPELVFVGNITGMNDCRWVNEGESTILGASVPLDREYALSSGLLEITYKFGAKVILEGPCAFKVDSDAGGYLERGKLTARVEAKGSGFGGQDSKHSPLSSLPSPLFAVRTPTALVTDLGTEFGVEVAENGDTVSCVFQGSIKVQGLSASADSGDSQEEKVLHENESIRVSRVRETHQDSGKTELVRFTHPTDTPKFVRQIPQQKIKTFDLVDVVAGGDGFSGRCSGGIDPTNGRIWKHRVDTSDYPVPREGDGQYHRVPGLPFVDGVFIPDGGGAAVQVDSAGHVFDWFSDTDNTTWRPIWAGGAFSKDHKYSSTVGGVDYASPGHGLLLMLANNAITFDLEAIRRANPGSKPLRFRAAVGMPGTEPVTKQYFADVLVLIDGKRRFQHRLEYNGQNAVEVAVKIQDMDRFLTLAATDAGDGIGHDWIIFGDPRLVLRAEQPKHNEGGRSTNSPK